LYKELVEARVEVGELHWRRLFDCMTNDMLNKIQIAALVASTTFVSASPLAGSSSWAQWSSALLASTPVASTSVANTTASGTISPSATQVTPTGASTALTASVGTTQADETGATSLPAAVASSSVPEIPSTQFINYTQYVPHSLQ